MPEQTTTVSLDRSDYYQILSGLDVLIEQWQATADYLSNGRIDPEVCIRESHSEHEATSIAEMYIAIRNKLRDQLT